MVVIIIFFPWQSFVHLDLPILKMREFLGGFTILALLLLLR